MKKLFVILLAMICMCCFAACGIYGGYNGIMYDYLSDEENYKSFQVKVMEICYRDNGEVALKVTFEKYEDVQGFYGLEPDTERPLEDYVFSLEINVENSKLLSENGFFEVVTEGDIIQVRATDWIYMDGFFFYIAEVNYNGVEYLNLEDGIKNIIRMMDGERTIL